MATLQATGLYAAVKTLGQAPFGKILLVLGAVGIAAFSAYNFVRPARTGCSGHCGPLDAWYSAAIYIG